MGGGGFEKGSVGDNGFSETDTHGIMTTIPVYKIDTAKGKLPKDAEVDRDANIENGFAYARDLPKDQQNFNYYAVTEDDDLKLFSIGDQVIAKEGAMLFMPVCCCAATSCLSKICYYVCMHQYDIRFYRSPWLSPPCRSKTSRRALSKKASSK